MSMFGTGKKRREDKEDDEQKTAAKMPPLSPEFVSLVNCKMRQRRNQSS